MAKYPEHEKLSAIQKQSQACGEFVEWLEQRNVIRFKKHGRLTALLAEFFDIDEDRLEEEKRAMLAACRELHEGKSSCRSRKTCRSASRNGRRPRS